MTLETQDLEPRLVRLTVGLFSLGMLALLLAASWLRAFVPAPRALPVRVRDVSWPERRAR